MSIPYRFMPFDAPRPGACASGSRRRRRRARDALASMSACTLQAKHDGTGVTAVSGNVT